jgi:hypothetical protein
MVKIWWEIKVVAKRKSTAFNDTQIKDGRIVRLRKDGRIKADLGPYTPKKASIKKIPNV